jgi:hypothetical protein
VPASRRSSRSASSSALAYGDERLDVARPHVEELLAGVLAVQRADRAGELGGVEVDRAPGRLEVGGAVVRCAHRLDHQAHVLGEQARHGRLQRAPRRVELRVGRPFASATPRARRRRP